MKKRFLVIIPARGGSKGIKRKNIIDLGGKPLIQYTVDTAKQVFSSELDEMIVSTDDKEIASIAESLKVKVPFLRPNEISTDKSKSIDFIIHAINFYRNKDVYFDSVILLQPTSPFRRTLDLNHAISLYLEKNTESLISVYKEEYVNELVMYHMDENIGIPLSEKHNKGVRRQEHKEVYVRNGAIYISKVEYLMEQQLIVSDNPALYVMPKNVSTNIDTIEDLEYARWLIEKLEY